MRNRYRLLCAAALGFFAFASPKAEAGPTAQNGVCPAIGSVTGTDCNVEIFAGANGAFSTLVTNSTPYDRVEDNLVGIINNSRSIIHSLTFNTPSGATYPLFAFDGDGLQSYPYNGPGNDPTGYGGMTSSNEYTTFTNISVSGNTGTVVFGASGIAIGGTAYFSLEGPPSVNLTPAVPEPGSLALLGFGLVGLAFVLRRKTPV